MPISPELQNALEFHSTFTENNCISDEPTLDVPEFKKMTRVAMVREEAQEVCEAITEGGDLAHIAKELADLQSIIAGTVVTFGLQEHWADIMQEVHRSNMSKVTPDGTVLYHPETGKIMKPDTYSPADIESIIKPKE